MDARELRIGNWVVKSNLDQSIDKDYQMKAHDFKEWHNSQYEPIFLTEDWLVKFGFEEHGMAIRKDVTTFLELCWIKGDSFRLQTIESGFTESANCQYVHSLQNLYFSLCGEELEIKNA